MLISHGHRFIFVHIQKTAGQSMRRALEPYCQAPPRVGLRKILSHLPVPEHAERAAFRPHATAAWARLKITPPVFERYTRFSVVRNPFDRAVSQFHFLQQRPEHHAHRHVRELGFDEYLEFLRRRRWHRDPTQQGRLVDGRGRMLCDPILRFETLQSDFAGLCRQLQLDDAPSLTHRNASSHRPWREYYDSRATRDRVIDLFARDFDAFGYDTRID